MYLIFDTETTGLPAWGAPPYAPGQPRICQLACLLLDEKFKEMASFKTLIQPDGWTINPHAEQAHGISLETCKKYGIPSRAAMHMFDALADKADLIIAHNLKFDSLMIDIESHHNKGPQYDWSSQTFCTMLNSTDICKLPGSKGRYKWPKLIEAHQHFFNQPFDGAHDAMADVRACARVFKHLVENHGAELGLSLKD